VARRADRACVGLRPRQAGERGVDGLVGRPGPRRYLGDDLRDVLALLVAIANRAKRPRRTRVQPRRWEGSSSGA